MPGTCRTDPHTPPLQPRAGRQDRPVSQARPPVPAEPATSPTEIDRPPRTSRRGGRALACALAAAAVVLVGCSDDSRATSTPEPRPMGPENPSRPPSPETWLDQVCTALVPAIRTSSPAPPIDPADPLGTRNRWVAYLETRQQTLDSAADGISAAGPAPGEAGVQVSATVLSVLRGRADAAQQSKEQLQAVPQNYPATLYRSVQEVQPRFPLAGPPVTLLDLALPPDLARAAAGVPSCRAAAQVS